MPARDDAAPPRPNIVVIFCDDLGYGDLGCYGSTVNRTPHLDGMAQSGMRFTDFYVGQPVCSPSRAALMTGCYPKRVGLHTGTDICVLRPGDPLGLSPDEVTVADLLRGQGYATALIGKWHLGDQRPFLPDRHGFDTYFGLPYSNDMGVREEYPDFPPLPLMQGTDIVEIEPDQSTLTHRYTERAQQFIREHREGPFFLYFAHMYVHTPLFPPEDFLRRAQNGPYGAEVECIDWSTGEILKTLRECGLEENTLVLFTSDNGSTTRKGSSNAPLRGRKGQTWEGGMRMPCIAQWPGRIPRAATCTELATTMDLLPTFAGLSGAQVPGDRIIDGHDIRPLLWAEPGAATPYEAFYYYANASLNAVRAGEWKLHVNTGELYNLAEDIGEQNELAARCPDVVRRLTDFANAARDDLGDYRAGQEGRNCRPPGRVENPVQLRATSGPSLDPHTQAEYD